MLYFFKMQDFGEILKFLLTIFFTCFVPGDLLVKFLKLKFSPLEKLVVSLVSGIVLFTVANFFLGILGVRFLARFFLVFLGIVWLLLFSKNLKPFSRFGFKKNYFFLIFVLLLGTFAQTSLLFESGRFIPGKGMFFKEARDSMWHLGLTAELVRKVPPIHPGHAPLPLTNYHYFYNLFTASIRLISGLSLLDLSYRFVPFLLSFLFGLSTFVLVRAWSKKFTAAVLAVFFAYFCGSFAFFIPILRPGSFWQESSFWVSQPFTMFINLPFASSLVIFTVAFFCLLRFLEKRTTNYFPILALLFGSLIGFKVYAGIVALGALFCLAIIEVFRKRDFLLLKLSLFSFLFSLALFLPSNAGSAASGFLVFSPGWYLRAMVESPDRVHIPDWILREQTFAHYGNWFGVLRLRIMEFFLFVIGNLGVRVLGLLGVLRILLKIKKISRINLFFIFSLLLAFLPPMFFIQKGSIANTIQFLYYFLAILNFYAALFVFDFLSKKSKPAKIFFLALIVALAIPTSLKHFWENLKFSGDFVSPVEMEAINALKTIPQDSIILLSISPRNTTAMHVCALSERRTYYSDRLMSENTLKDFKKREDLINKFFTTFDQNWAKSFLFENGIDYVYLYSGEKPSIKPEDLDLREFFRNEQVAIYKL